MVHYNSCSCSQFSQIGLVVKNLQVGRPLHQRRFKLCTTEIATFGEKFNHSCKPSKQCCEFTTVQHTMHISPGTPYGHTILYACRAHALRKRSNTNTCQGVLVLKHVKFTAAEDRFKQRHSASIQWNQTVWGNITAICTEIICWIPSFPV